MAKEEIKIEKQSSYNSSSSNHHNPDRDNLYIDCDKREQINRNSLHCDQHRLALSLLLKDVALAVHHWVGPFQTQLGSCNDFAESPK